VVQPASGAVEHAPVLDDPASRSILAALLTTLDPSDRGVVRLEV
jgi:hypothetical protein